MKPLAVILLIVIFPIFLGTLLLLSLKLTVFNPSYVKGELRESNAYSIIYKNIPELTKGIGPGSEGGDAAQAEEGTGAPFSPEETAAFFYNTVSEQNLQEKTEVTIDTVWPWVFGGKELKTISIADVRQKLSDNILDSFRKKYEALPYCKDPSEFKYDIKTCKLRGKSFDELLKEFQLKQTGNANTPLNMAGNIPNEVDIQKLTEPNPQLKSKFAGAQDVRSKVSPVLANVYLIFSAVLVITFLISRLFAGAWRKTPKVFGIYLAIVSSVFLITSLISTRLAFPKLIDFANKKIQTLPAIKNQLLVPMVKDILNDVGGMQVKISIILISLGIVLSVAFWILNKHLFIKSDKEDEGSGAQSGKTKNQSV